jgi:putative transposase
MMIEPKHKRISMSHQCDLIGLPRASYYYAPKGDDRYNQQMMNLIDEQFTKTPFYGVPRITACLRRQGHEVNPKRIRRLMRRMGLEAIYPKKRLSKAHPARKKYPYLLRDVLIDRPDQAWCADITYVRLQQGFVYLVAIMDWHSRYVLAWDISITMDAAFCIQALEQALTISRPEIFNSDQGVQFTSADFTSVLEREGVRISMDGRGRVYDNIFVERLWRSVKYEEVYLHQYLTVADARRGLERYFHFYNMERIHESLGYQTPHEIYYEKPLNQKQTKQAA